jgi:hypothetical protein
MKRLTALLALVGFLFTSAAAIADCGGCPAPKDLHPEIQEVK